MNEKILDKFFKLYSLISYSYAKKQKIQHFLVSSYCINKKLIYPYEYIDFELMLVKDKHLKITNENVVIYIAETQTEYTDVCLFLYNMNNKIKNNLELIVESDFLNLNAYYKKFR